MSVLSVLKGLKFDGRVLIPILIAVALLLRTASSTSPTTNDRDDADSKVEELSYCDENLINDRDASKR